MRMNTAIDAGTTAAPEGGGTLPDEQRDRVMLALADPTRRAILELLVQGDARVTELARPFPISLNSVSKHIRMLERADLVQRRRNGREHIITLNPTALDDAAQWMNQQRTAWHARLDALDRMLQEQDAHAHVHAQASAPTTATPNQGDAPDDTNQR